MRGCHRNPRESSSATAARFLRFYQQRVGCEPRLYLDRRIPKERPRDTRTPKERPRDTRLFRSMVLQHIGMTPRPATEILRAVVDDYGSCGARRFWRAIKFWIVVGRIEKNEDGYRRVSKRRDGGRT